MKAAAFAALALLTASAAQAQSVRAELAKLKGQPVQDVVARLGAPEAQEPAGSGTAYVWTSEMRVRNAPVVTNRTDFGAGRPNRVQAIEYANQIQTCRLRVVADEAGKVTDATTSDANQACASLVRKLAATP